jgi:hypothetical protein
MSDEVDLNEFLEADFKLVGKYNTGTEDRKTYLDRIQSATSILLRTEIDENNAGSVVFKFEKVDPKLNYYPSIFALQMLFENIKLDKKDAAYPDITVPNVTKETVDRFVTALYNIDRNDGVPWRKTDSRFHMDFPNVYGVLRIEILKRRYARSKVRITNAVEKIALDKLLEDKDITEKLQKLEKEFPEAGKLSEQRTRALLVLAKQETQSYIDNTFFARFMAKVDEQAPPPSPTDEDDED